MPYADKSLQYAAQREWRQRNKGYWRKYDPTRDPVKVDARKQLYSALRRGLAVKPATCQDCGSDERLQGHHDNYERPLDVKWLCEACHKELDCRLRPRKTARTLGSGD